MKTISCVLLPLAAALWCSGCASDRHATSNLTEGGKKTLQTEAALCNPHCEQVAYSYKTDPNTFHPVGLRPAEEASLKAAAESTVVSRDIGKVHLHADAINGSLVFLPDSPNDPTRESHDSAAEISLRNTQAGASPAVKIVATPAALELLRQRAH